MFVVGWGTPTARPTLQCGPFLMQRAGAAVGSISSRHAPLPGTTGSRRPASAASVLQQQHQPIKFHDDPHHRQRPTSAPADSAIALLQSSVGAGSVADAGAELTFVIDGVQYRTRVNASTDVSGDVANATAAAVHSLHPIAHHIARVAAEPNVSFEQAVLLHSASAFSAFIGKLTLYFHRHN